MRVAFADQLVAVDVENGGDEAGDADGAEDGAVLVEGEVVVCGVDEGNGGKGEVEDRPGKGDPETEEEDGRFCKEEEEGAVDGDADGSLEAGALLVGLYFPAYALSCGVGRIVGLWHLNSDNACCFKFFIVLVDGSRSARE